MKRIVVNFVSLHSYIYEEQMVSGLVNQGYRILAIVSKNMAGIEKWRAMKGVKLFEVDGYTKISDFPVKLLKFFLYDAPRLKRIIKEYEFDASYIPKCSYWSLFIYHVINRIPLVYTMHDPIVHNSENHIMAFCNSYLSKHASLIIILSDTFRELVKLSTRLDYSQIVTIPSGQENVMKSSNDKKIVKYDNDKVNFLFYGQISKHKGLEILAAAYKKLRKENDHVTLTVAGNGDFNSYKEQYEKLPDCTIVNRWIENDEINGLFNDKNVITVLPYLTATQSGVVNVAMPSGSPIIATDTGGMREQIENEKTGFLVEPGDVEGLYEKMKYVAEHITEMDYIRENAYRRMKSLSWDNLSSRLANAIEVMRGMKQ